MKSSELRVVDLASNDEQVQTDIRTLIKATYERDFPSVLKYTHPKIIAAMGGRAQAESTLETTFAKIGPMTSESFEFPETPTYLETDRNYYVIVPTLSIMSANGQQVESLNFQFGMPRKRRQTGNTWKDHESIKGIFGPSSQTFPRPLSFPNSTARKSEVDEARSRAIIELNFCFH